MLQHRSLAGRRAGGNLGEAHLKTYIGTLAALAAALVASWVYWDGVALDARFILGTAVFAILALAGDSVALRLNERSSIGVSDVGLVVAVAVLGPLWAALAAMPADVLAGRRDPLRTLYEVSHSIVIVFLSGMVFGLVSEPLLGGEGGPPTVVSYGAIMAGATLVSANRTIDAILLKVKHGTSFHETWLEVTQPYLLSDVLNVLTAGLGVLALASYGPIAAVVVVAGSLGSQALVYRSREQAEENRELRARVGTLEEALATSNTTFGAMIIQDLGRRDGYTHRHAAATATYTADLAREMRLDATHAERLRMAGLLHNVGLFGLPEDLLVATGRLNSIARSRLEEHPTRGAEALAAVSEFEEMAQWVRWHHERPDGRGYPDKLRGPWIPLEAKMLSVAQAYAAMVLDQPRRPGMRSVEAREKLSAGIDTEFDGVVVRALLRLLDTESEGYRMADDHRFVFPSPESGGGARAGASDLRHGENLRQTLPR